MNYPQMHRHSTSKHTSSGDNGVIALVLYQKDLDRQPDPLIQDEEAQATPEELVNANLRFAYTVATECQNKGLDLEDLIGLANQGLIEAAQRFDPTRGCRFITFAVWYIRRAIIRGLSKSSTVPLPRKNYGQGERIYTSSLNAPITSAPDAPEGWEYLADRTAQPDELVIEEDLCTHIASLISALPDRERLIVCKLYGLDGQAHTLEAIGQQIGLTKERVRQLKEKALSKLAMMA